MFLANPNIVAVCVESIQGEGGIIVPDPGYLKNVKDLCKMHNVLMISDEIQTGYGRTGKFWAHEWDEIRPDIIVTGKSFSGGFLPASAAICDSHIMDVIGPGDHGSTYGGMPLAMAVAHASLTTLLEEGMVENALNMGNLLMEGIRGINSKTYKEVRGKGLFIGCEIRADSHVDGNDLAKACLKQGIITKATKNSTVRFTPPLIINKQEVEMAVEKIALATKEIEQLSEQRGN